MGHLVIGSCIGRDVESAVEAVSMFISWKDQGYINDNSDSLFWIHIRYKISNNVMYDYYCINGHWLFFQLKEQRVDLIWYYKSYLMIWTK